MFAKWFGDGNGPPPDLGPAAAWAFEHGAEEELEYRLTRDLEGGERERLAARWRAACRAAAYRAEKRAELDEAPDATAAADAVSRWGLFGSESSAPAPFPAVDAPPLSPTVSVPVLRGAVLHKIVEFFADTGTPHALLKAEPGAGKTRSTLKHLRSIIDEDRIAGRPHRRVYAVPDHQLSAETEANARALGINAVVLKGRSEDNCKQQEACDLAVQAGVRSVRSAVCGPDRNGNYCPSRDWCDRLGYFANLRRARGADLLIVAHSYLFGEGLPKEVLHDLAGVVIDEGFADLLDYRSEITLDSLSAESLACYPVRAEGETDRAATAEAVEISKRIDAAVRPHVGDYIPAQEIRAAGITLADLARLRALTWAREVDPGMRPGMRTEDRAEAARAAGINRKLRRIIALTHALEGMLTRGDAGAGLVRGAMRDTKEGDSFVLEIGGQKKLAKWLEGLPVLMLDGTGRLSDVRRAFPDAKLVGLPRAETSHATLVHHVGGFGHSTIMRSERKRAALLFDVKLAAQSGPVLVVTHKKTEHLFQGIQGVETAHHGAIVGQDIYKDVRHVFVVGGPSASPKDIAAIAAARGGGAVPIAKPVRVNRTMRLADGSAKVAPGFSYEHPAAEDVHRGIHDSGIHQAYPRSRPLDRTADTPVNMHVYSMAIEYTGSVLPAEVRRWRPHDRFTTMVADGAVWSNAVHAAHFRKDLFASPKAAEQALYRSVGRRADMREAVRAIVREFADPWIEVAYQRPGQGHKLDLHWCPAGSTKALRAAIEAELGPVVRWHVRSFTAGRKDSPTVEIDINPGAGMSSADLPILPPHMFPEWPRTAPRAPPDG